MRRQQKPPKGREVRVTKLFDGHSDPRQGRNRSRREAPMRYHHAVRHDEHAHMVQRPLRARSPRRRLRANRPRRGPNPRVGKPEVVHSTESPSVGSRGRRVGGGRRDGASARPRRTTARRQDDGPAPSTPPDPRVAGRPVDFKNSSSKLGPREIEAAPAFNETSGAEQKT